MKKNLLIAFLVLLLLFSISDVMTVSTPELFGRGTMYLLRVGGAYAGYINAWGGWAIYGKGENCHLLQIAGEQIHDAEHAVPCHMGLRDDVFSGWIDFRGQHRPFCGGYDNLPKKCKGE